MPQTDRNEGITPSLPDLRKLLLLAAEEARNPLLARVPAGLLAEALQTLPPAVVRQVLGSLAEPMRDAAVAAAEETLRGKWAAAARPQANTVGALMRPPLGVVPQEATAAEAVALVRRIASVDLTYLYPVDEKGRVTGVVVLRDLFLAPPDQPVRAFMVQPAFFLTPTMTVLEAMRAVVGRHFPVYPVCEPDGVLLGLVRGHVLFENQVVTITAQAGKLEGLRASEDARTGFWASLRMRLPWLGLNLLLSLVSALVMLSFKPTLGRFVILAIFVSVIATQGRNSGAQTMAVALRGITNGTWDDRRRYRLLLKEAALGCVSGAAIGLLAAAAIWLEEWRVGNPAAPVLALTVFLGMVGGCVLSCVAGVHVPLLLRRLGYDPALAAGILHTNISTVCCQTLFLLVAIWLLG